MPLKKLSLEDLYVLFTETVHDKENTIVMFKPKVLLQINGKGVSKVEITQAIR